mmetsp:Transcript_29826/g.79318  ORF Transcript_29826/g.79318 Transcript_29826/m.79318 type:complete len:222 (-) Transcript_29826:1774-2439(-)
MFRGVASLCTATSATRLKTGTSCASNSCAKLHASTMARSSSPGLGIPFVWPSRCLLNCSPGSRVIAIHTLHVSSSRSSVSRAIRAGSLKSTSSDAASLSARVFSSVLSNCASIKPLCCQHNIFLMATLPWVGLSAPHTTPKLPLPNGRVTLNGLPSIFITRPGLSSPASPASCKASPSSVVIDPALGWETSDSSSMELSGPGGKVSCELSSLTITWLGLGC